MALTIDVFSDIVCPWCLIGKRQLEQAIAQFGQPVSVQWRAFQLNPDMPAEGMSRKDYLQQKFGKSDPSVIYARVKQAAAQVGLTLNIEAIIQQPNTRQGHALLKAAFLQGGATLQAHMNEALFTDYFMQGGDLTSEVHLRELAVQSGLSAATIDSALSDADALTAVMQEDADARAAGISGVPFFIFNRKIAVSGAQGSEALLQAMHQAL